MQWMLGLFGVNLIQDLQKEAGACRVVSLHCNCYNRASFACNLDVKTSARAINRDVLVPRKGGRFAFGRLIDRQGSMVGLLPPGHGEKQQVVDNPAWIAVAEMLVRRL